MKAESMKEPMPFSTMPMMDETMGKYETGGHKAHHNEFKKHAAGHTLHHEATKAMCKGGKA